MFHRITCAALLGLSSLTTLAAEPSHQHGVAALNLSQDADMLRIEFVTPLDNLVGFEHSPTSPRETAALRTAAQRLREAGRLFSFPEAAGCRPLGVRLSADFIKPSLLGEPANPGPVNAVPVGGHGDLSAEYSFRCAQPATLRSAEIRLFPAFARLRQINVQVAAGDVQHAVRLTPANRTLQW